MVKVRTDERLPVGERIYVFGFLGSKQFSLDDGRLRQKLTIKSNYIRLRGHEHSVQSKDVNNVKISAQITSNIRTTDKYSLFTLALMHSLKYVEIFCCFLFKIKKNSNIFSCLYLS